MPIGVIGMGSYVPDRVVTNADIAAWTGATAEWVLDRTGIHERRYADDGCLSSDLGAIAAEQAIAAAPGVRHQLETIVMATCTPDVPIPATAAILQHKLGISG